MSNVDLVVAPCTYKAAKYAVMHWHYSKAMPAGKNVYLGAWENGNYIGVVIFGSGVSPVAGMKYNLKNIEVCELVRVALTGHQSPVSQIVSKSLSQLKKQSPGVRLVVSYADPEQGHNGGIYQAMNWVYVGTIKAEWFVENSTGKRINTKTLKTGRRGYATKLKREGIISSVQLTKHKYLYPLDKAMRRQIEPLAQPYPKRADVGEMESRVTTSD